MAGGFRWFVLLRAQPMQFSTSGSLKLCIANFSWTKPTKPAKETEKTKLMTDSLNFQFARLVVDTA